MTVGRHTCEAFPNFSLLEAALSLNRAIQKYKWLSPTQIADKTTSTDWCRKERCPCASATRDNADRSSPRALLVKFENAIDFMHALKV